MARASSLQLSAFVGSSLFLHHVPGAYDNFRGTSGSIQHTHLLTRPTLIASSQPHPSPLKPNGAKPHLLMHTNMYY